MATKNTYLTIQGSKVIVSRAAVALFNGQWPGSQLRAGRSYWFEFAKNQSLVDTDVPEHSDGPEALALSEDCEAYLFEGTLPSYLEGL
jgi:hypothetical protein